MMSKSKIASVVTLFVAAALIITKFFFIDFAIIPQNGMFPGVPAGSFIFFKRRPYSKVANVRRGDVVLFDWVERDGKQYRYVWHVIGLPRDKVEVVGEAWPLMPAVMPKEIVMSQDVDDKFYDRADAHIHLSNDQLKDVARGKVSASMMYSVARFNAWVSACGFQSAEEMRDARDETIAYFTTEYRKMLEENLDDYIVNFKKYMVANRS